MEKKLSQNVKASVTLLIIRKASKTSLVSSLVLITWT